MQNWLGGAVKYCVVVCTLIMFGWFLVILSLYVLSFLKLFFCDLFVLFFFGGGGGGGSMDD